MFMLRGCIFMSLLGLLFWASPIHAQVQATFQGDLLVGGNDIKSSANRPAISINDPANSAVADVTCNGALKVDGNIIRDSTGLNTICMQSGAVGIGWGDPSTTYTPKELFQVGDDKGVYFHNGDTAKAMCWNASWSIPADSFQRVTADSSARLFMDYFHDRFSIHIADTGTAGDNVSFDNHGITVDNNGNVGIKTETPNSQAALDVNGVIRLSGASSPSIGGCIYLTSDGYLKAKDLHGSNSTFSPHEDPRVIDPNAKCSFSDPTVELPFSFAHENAYIGKGAVVDMAKMVNYVEKKMQAEMGSEAGKLVYGYDMPKEKCRTVDDRETDILVDELNSMPDIKVPLGTDGAIPAEALEDIDETTRVTQVITTVEKVADFKSQKVVSKNHTKSVEKEVKTGRKTKRFKKEWALVEGELHRRPTVEDLDLDAIAKKHPALPQWVLDRVKGGKQAKQSLSSLVEDIKKKMQARASKSPDKQTLASNTQIQ